MGAAGFEPAKAFANGFTARPLWPARAHAQRHNHFQNNNLPTLAILRLLPVQPKVQLDLALLLGYDPIHDATGWHREAIEAVPILPAYTSPRGAMGEKRSAGKFITSGRGLTQTLPWNVTLRLQRIFTQGDSLRYLRTA